MRSDQKALADIYSRIITESNGRKVVKGDVTITKLYLRELPEWLADVEIEGGFYCTGNLLTSLKNAPKIVKGAFSCDYNKLTSLVGAPETAEDDFYCDHNKLASLQGAPTIVKGSFYCNKNKLKTLKGAPKIVRGYFVCGGNAVEFEEEDVEAVCDVGYNISV
jgi:hypothetical protein